MSKNDKSSKEPETVLMALDQISQTIDVMTSVVGRLRNYVEQQDASRSNDKHPDLHEEMQSDRVLH